MGKGGGQSRRADTMVSDYQGRAVAFATGEPSLPRLLKGRKTGPVFLTDRKARVELPPCDIHPASGRARLSSRQGGGPFKAPSRHAALPQPHPPRPPAR